MFNSVAKYLWGGSTNNEQDYTDRNTLEEQHGSGERLETQQEEDWEVVRTAGEITNSDLQRTENEESSEQPVVNDQVQVQNDDQRRAHSNVLRPINIDVHAAIHPGPFSPQHLVKSVHLAQRLQHTKAQKMISKSKCERQNKVREYHGHAKGNSRRNKHLCPSGFRSSRFSQRV